MFSSLLRQLSLKVNANIILTFINEVFFAVKFIRSNHDRGKPGNRHGYFPYAGKCCKTGRLGRYVLPGLDRRWFYSIMWGINLCRNWVALPGYGRVL